MSETPGGLRRLMAWAAAPSRVVDSLGDAHGVEAILSTELVDSPLVTDRSIERLLSPVQLSPTLPSRSASPDRAPRTPASPRSPRREPDRDRVAAILAPHTPDGEIQDPPAAKASTSASTSASTDPNPKPDRSPSIQSKPTKWPRARVPGPDLANEQPNVQRTGSNANANVNARAQASVSPGGLSPAEASARLLARVRQGGAADAWTTPVVVDTATTVTTAAAVASAESTIWSALERVLDRGTARTGANGVPRRRPSPVEDLLSGSTAARTDLPRRADGSDPAPESIARPGVPRPQPAAPPAAAPPAAMTPALATPPTAMPPDASQSTDVRLTGLRGLAARAAAHGWDGRPSTADPPAAGITPPSPSGTTLRASVATIAPPRPYAQVDDADLADRVTRLFAREARRHGIDVDSGGDQ